jgi:hypothetical protein
LRRVAEVRRAALRAGFGLRRGSIVAAIRFLRTVRFGSATGRRVRALDFDLAVAARLTLVRRDDVGFFFAVLREAFAVFAARLCVLRAVRLDARAFTERFFGTADLFPTSRLRPPTFRGPHS